jgi:hypothetical protein
MDKPIAKLKLLTTKGEVVDAILYCHQETIRLGSFTYYLLKLDTPADASGTTLSVPTANTGTWGWGSFMFPLAGIAKILSGTIYATYRAYTGGGTVNAQIDISIVDSVGNWVASLGSGLSPSANLGTSWATYTGASFNLTEYTVPDQSYYLRIDYMANVTAKKAGQYAYLRIDDSTLSLADQTRSQEWSFQAAGVTVTVTDAVGLSDVALCNKTLAVSDSVGLADTPLKGWTPTVTDAVTLVETVLRNKAFSILDSVGLADVVYRGNQLTLTDAVSLTDAIFRNKQFAVQDALSLADAVLSHKQLRVLDTVSLADVALALKTLLLTDSISLSDAVEVLAGAIIKVVEDSVGLSDAVYRNKSLIISDAVSLVEQVLRHKPLLPVSDVLTLAEVVSISKLLAVSDAIGLTDVAKILKQLRVSDSVTLTDAAQVPSRILAVLDSIGLSDAVKVDKALIVSDQIALVEAVYAGKVKRAKLFLIIGNMVMDLTTGEVNFAVG